MKYQVKYHPKAIRELDKLPKELTRRIVKKMRKVGETGRNIESVEDENYDGKVRVGDYRVLVDLEYNPNTIWVMKVDFRDSKLVALAKRDPVGFLPELPVCGAVPELADGGMSILQTINYMIEADLGTQCIQEALIEKYGAQEGQYLAMAYLLLEE